MEWKVRMKWSISLYVKCKYKSNGRNIFAIFAKEYINFSPSKCIVWSKLCRVATYSLNKIVKSLATGSSNEWLEIVTVILHHVLYYIVPDICKALNKCQ